MPRTSNKIYYHRRSQSLPPRLGTKITFLHQEYLKNLFTNPYIQTYRFHSGLGGDICVHETMAESKLCFQFPQQLLGIWIQEEKELLQEVAGVGELKEPWHSKQLELIDRHLHLLYLYSQAKENLAAFEGSNFKQSSRKNDRSLEFAPVNLHLQRMWVYNDTLCKYGLYDIISVGVFTAHSHKSKNGGLLRLVQALQDSSIKGSQLYRETSRISMAEEAIQAIKQLRRDVVEAMCSLMKLAKEKQTSGMLSICENMLSKTRILLSLWDPGLVEEALTFLEEYKISKDQDNIQKDDAHIPEFNISHSVSPFERITQQLKFDLKYPEFDEFFTSDTSDYVQDIWSKETSRSKFFSPYSENFVPKYIPYNLWVEDEFKEIDTAEYTAKNNFKIQSSNNYKTDDERKSDFDRSNDLDLSKRFLDTQKICKSPSANYYKPTDELEPWDLTQLNIEASLMCLVSKVKFLCGRCNSPAVRLRKKNNLERNQALIGCLENITSNYPYIVTIQPKTGIKNEETSILLEKDTQHFIPALDKESCTASKAKGVSRAIDCMTQVIKNSSGQRIKFIEGLDLSTIRDWTNELRPSMKKLLQVLDGLLKIARLTHSIFRVQEDAKTAQRMCNVRYRRDVCFSQALTALVSGFMAKLWCQRPDPIFLLILTRIGPLVSFEGLLSYYGDEIDMWGDMTIAAEDMHTVMFTLSRCGIHTSHIDGKQIVTQLPLPRVIGSRTALTVLLPVPDAIYSLLPLIPSTKETLSFNVTPVFFNIGINEMASLAESLCKTEPQEKSNFDNFERLNAYYLKFNKLNLPTDPPSARPGTHSALNQTLSDMMINLKSCVESKIRKNVEILQLSSQICRRMQGLRFTSCKSAKDRTGMSITLEQVNILATEYHLAEDEFVKALDCMRSEGCRRENTWKNIGVRKYAFNSLQIMTFPKHYRPPTGTYGSMET